MGEQTRDYPDCLTRNEQSFDFAGEKVFSRGDYFVYFLLTCISVFSIIDFGRHWISIDGWAEYPVALLLITIVLILKLMEHQARWLMLPLMKKPLVTSAPEGLKVAVVTTFVPGGEPLAMLEESLSAMVAITYPHETWVLDEEDDELVKALCMKLGAKHFSRRNLSQYQTREGTFKSQSKHGNINAWLHEIGFARYEFVTAFDPDHIPAPTFLTSVLGYFKDSKVGYVQAPAAYHNQNASFIARGAAEETYSYYSCTQMAAHALGHPFVTGCHNTHRVAALKEVGGFAAHNADDLLITLLYRNHGWRGVYVPRTLARGLVPVNWNDYLGQQVRWARSILDVKLRRYQRLQQKLSVVERFTALIDGVVYLQSSITIPIMVVVLAIVLASKNGGGGLSSPTLIKFITMCAVLQAASFYRQRFFIDPRTEWGLHWRAKLLRYAKWPHILMAFRDVLFRRDAPYTLTLKVNSGSSMPSVLWPHYLTIVVIGSAWIVGVVRDNPVNPILQVCAAISIVGTLFLILSERMKFPSPYQKSQTPETMGVRPKHVAAKSASTG